MIDGDEMNSFANILLVDDEERFTKSLHTILSHYHYSCTEAFSGSEAVKLLGERSFDLALLDVDLPDMSGYTVLEHIKTSNNGPTVIMLTGLNTVETAVMALKKGAYDFFTKPINYDLLLKTIARALQHNKLCRELEAGEERFRVLVEASWEGLVIHSNGRFLEANDQFLSMFGYSKNELKEGQFLDKILDPSSLQTVCDRIERGILGNYEAIGRKKEGQLFPIEAKTRSMNYLGETVRVCAIRDLSERVKAEEEKFALNRKLEKANKIRSLGLMAGAIAHDLNNILTGVVSYSDLLLAQMQPEERFFPHIRKIKESGKRAAAVVSDLVTLSRGNSVSRTVHNINDIILSHFKSIEHTERLSHYPGVLIKTNLKKNISNVCCSPQQIHKVLLNMIGNALEAVKEDGIIAISTQDCKFAHPMSLDAKTSRDYVKLTIADNGPGISQKDLEHVFEPFYSTKVMGKSGTGLGLSIVWNTVQEHDGWIEIKNNNPGAIFEIFLPSTAEGTCTLIDESDYRPLRGNGETILLIDDQAEQNETVSELLSILGYRTFSASSGEEGLAFLRAHSAHLVLLDMIMGDGLNGYETYKEILQINPKQRAIIISGYAPNEDYRETINLGASMLLEKPVTLVELGSAIKHSLSHE